MKRSALAVAALGLVATTVAACGSGHHSDPKPAGHDRPPASPSAAPAAKDAAAVVAGLAAAGMPAKLTVTYTSATDPNHLLGRPNGYTSKVSFADSRIKPDDARDSEPGSVDLGGSVEVFPDAAAAGARRDYIQGALKGHPALGSEYDYVSGGVLLRLSEVLTPEQAQAYAKVLPQVVS